MIKMVVGEAEGTRETWWAWPGAEERDEASWRVSEGSMFREKAAESLVLRSA